MYSTVCVCVCACCRHCYTYFGYYIEFGIWTCVESWISQIQLHYT